MCPHLGAHLWQTLGFDSKLGSMLDAPWPDVDEAALEQDNVTLVLQINGKLRGQLVAPKTADQPTLEKMALAHDAVQKQMQELGIQTAKKVIVVPNRLVNVVV